jgi:hypothetical protein
VRKEAMRFFYVLDFQYLILALFFGILSVFLIYLGFMSYRFSQKRKEEGETAEESYEYPGGLRIQNHPLSPLLIFICLGFALWAIAYVILIGLRGGPF